jgi:hypothetical protein
VFFVHFLSFQLLVVPSSVFPEFVSHTDAFAPIFLFVSF